MDQVQKKRFLKEKKLPIADAWALVAFADRINEGKYINQNTFPNPEGYRFNKGYTSQYFITNQDKKEVDFTKSIILLYDGKITSIDPLNTLVANFASSGQELVIIASDIDEQANIGLVMQKVNFKSNIVVVKAPFRGSLRTDFFNDLAVLIGAKVISEEMEKMKNLIGYNRKTQ